jgi:hypothetical protein
MEYSSVDRKALAAALLGCQPEELLGFRDEGLSGVVLIAPDGRKLRYPEELLRRAQAWLVENPVGQVSKPAIHHEDGRIESRPTKRARRSTGRQP